MRIIPQLSLLAMTIVFLQGCFNSGGSSDGDDSLNDSQEQLAVNAGKDQSVEASDEVRLEAKISNSSGTPPTYEWKQKAGPEFAFQSPDAATVTFTTPNVQEEETLTIEVSVSEANGTTVTDAVNIKVSPLPKRWTNYKDEFEYSEHHSPKNMALLSDMPDKLYTAVPLGNGSAIFADYAAGSITVELDAAVSILPNPGRDGHLVALRDGNIMESFDDGATWVVAAKQGDLPTLNGRNLRYTPDGKALFLYTDGFGTRVSSPNPGITRSLDDGRTWASPVGLPGFPGVGPVATSKTDARRLIAVVGASNVYRSLDYGASWTQLDSVEINCLGFSDVEISPHDENVALLLSRMLDDPAEDCRLTLRKTTDGGETWKESELPDLPYLNSDGFAMCASPAAEGLYYFATTYADEDRGSLHSERKAIVAKTTDGEGAWTPVNSLPHTGLPSDLNWIYTGGGVSNMKCAKTADGNGTVIYLALSDGKGAYRYVDEK